MNRPSCSVLIASRDRARPLAKCLRSLAAQTVLPAEVIVAWQGDDAATGQKARELAGGLPYELKVVHSTEVGIVPAENAAMRTARGEIILLIDDDAAAPPDWVEKHLAFYEDRSIGAVGGPYMNHTPDLQPYPARMHQPLGKLTWYGKSIGNLHDHHPSWRSRAPIGVDHLGGGNFSFRRSALRSFEERLRPYWQMFELEACLQIKKNGYKVVFDYSNPIDHYPTNTAYCGGREGDLDIKIFNAAFNHAFILSKHTQGFLRAARFAYLFLVGAVSTPGLLGALAGVSRYGNPARELRILRQTWGSLREGWREGKRSAIVLECM